MAVALTQEQYLARAGLVCPLCRSGSVKGEDNVSVASSGAWQKISCRKCKATWIDQYELTGFEGLEDNLGTSVPEGLFFEGDIGWTPYSLLGRLDLPTVTYKRKYRTNAEPTSHKIYMLDPNKILELLNLWNARSEDWKYYMAAGQVGR